jgi:hypothetical protein
MKTRHLLVCLALVAACKKQGAADKPAGIPAQAGAPAGGEAAGPGPGTPAAPPAPSAALPPTALPVHPPGEAESAVPEPSRMITGTIVLPAPRKRDVPKDAVVFIIARRADGPPPGMMLAVQKHPVGDFPMPFALSGRDAMVPNTPFEGVVNLTVRIDKDGDGLTRKKGDLFGQANGIKVGSQNITVSVDMVQAQDETLGGPRPPGPAPGLPPGHP